MATSPMRADSPARLPALNSSENFMNIKANGYNKQTRTARPKSAGAYGSTLRTKPLQSESNLSRIVVSASQPTYPLWHKPKKLKKELAVELDWNSTGIIKIRKQVKSLRRQRQQFGFIDHIDEAWLDKTADDISPVDMNNLYQYRHDNTAHDSLASKNHGHESLPMLNKKKTNQEHLSITSDVSQNKKIQQFDEWIHLRDNYLRQLDVMIQAISSKDNQSPAKAKDSVVASKSQRDSFLLLFLTLRKITFRLVSMFASLVGDRDVDPSSYRPLRAYFANLVFSYDNIPHEPFMAWIGVDCARNPLLCAQTVDGLELRTVGTVSPGTSGRSIASLSSSLKLPMQQENQCQSLHELIWKTYQEVNKIDSIPRSGLSRQSSRANSLRLMPSSSSSNIKSTPTDTAFDKVGRKDETICSDAVNIEQTRSAIRRSLSKASMSNLSLMKPTEPDTTRSYTSNHSLPYGDATPFDRDISNHDLGIKHDEYVYVEEDEESEDEGSKESSEADNYYLIRDAELRFRFKVWFQTVFLRPRFEGIIQTRQNRIKRLVFDALQLNQWKGVNYRRLQRQYITSLLTMTWKKWNQYHKSTKRLQNLYSRSIQHKKRYAYDIWKEHCQATRLRRTFNANRKIRLEKHFFKAWHYEAILRQYQKRRFNMLQWQYLNMIAAEDIALCSDQSSVSTHNSSPKRRPKDSENESIEVHGTQLSLPLLSHMQYTSFLSSYRQKYCFAEWKKKLKLFRTIRIMERYHTVNQLHHGFRCWKNFIRLQQAHRDGIPMSPIYDRFFDLTHIGSPSTRSNHTTPKSAIFRAIPNAFGTTSLNVSKRRDKYGPVDLPDEQDNEMNDNSKGDDHLSDLDDLSPDQGLETAPSPSHPSRYSDVTLSTQQGHNLNRNIVFGHRGMISLLRESRKHATNQMNTALQSVYGAIFSPFVTTIFSNALHSSQRLLHGSQVNHASLRDDRTNE